MVNKSLDHRTTPPGGLVGVIARTTLRVLQIIVALVVAGLYGDNLNKARKAGQKAESAFIYSEVVVGLSIITAIVYLLPILKSYKFFFWDTIILYIPSTFPLDNPSG